MYKAVRGLAHGYVQVFHGLKVKGHENIPTTGGAIIAATHLSAFDPIAVAGAISRPIHFMAKVELFRYPILKQLLPKVHCFPVKRGASDRNAIRQAIQVVQDGNLLGIFPEGTRSTTDGEMLPLQGGVALIAIKAGAPVIPVVVRGVRPLRLRRPVEVIIGKPIDFGGPKKVVKSEILQASERISQEFSMLLSRNIHENEEINTGR